MKPIWHLSTATLFVIAVLPASAFAQDDDDPEQWIPIGGLLADVAATGKAQEQNTQVVANSGPTDQEIEWARTAWSYFVANEHPKTGLVAAVNNFNYTTLWDEGGYFLAIVAAFRLGILSEKEAKARASKALSSLAVIPLFQGKLPNKVYNTGTLKMTDYANKETPNSVGWSALDIMRLLSGMLVVTQQFPDLKPKAQKVINRWDMNLLASEGRFQGIAVNGSANNKFVQEGRIGYEQYAGVIALELGLPVELASRYYPILRHQRYHDILIPGDIRTEETHGVSSVTTSEPFLLEALEFGWRPASIPVARAVYEAQVFRYEQTGHLTALSEDHIKGKLYFAYNAILMDNVPFISVTAKRVNVSDKRGISTKGSFGWWALMQDDYSQKLLNAVKLLQSDRGCYAGLFESDLSASKILTMNTNAVVLDSLYYKNFGPLFQR
ncbi:MAG: DUF3131 domain-containing protein [Amylibacter sp.]